jgi:chromatin-remodeling ATPase INO80
LRKFWNPKHLYTKDSPFHVVVTSYGLILVNILSLIQKEDEKMFQKVNWQYMVLDEAHAIKSSKSARWKTLLNFNCRNRMLLSGTPIQNNMAGIFLFFLI